MVQVSAGGTDVGTGFLWLLKYLYHLEYTERGAMGLARHLEGRPVLFIEHRGICSAAGSKNPSVYEILRDLEGRVP